MTNFEKWKDKCLDILAYTMALVDEKPVACRDIDCHNCDLEHYSCKAKAKEWLLAEYKEPAPKLTKREREFLETFSVMDKAIKRDRLLYLHCNTYKGGFDFSIRPKLFPFIKNGESWSFEELMKLEVEE